MSPPWKLWRTQALAVCRFELRRTFMGRRSLPIYVLAALPIMLFAMRLLPIVQDEMRRAGVAFSTMLFAGVYQAFILRFVIYFGCVAVFMNLFRGEVLDRSLHYYFLSPIRREVLLVGKFLSGIITTCAVFVAMTAFCYFLLYLPHGATVMREQFLGGPALSHLFAYLGVAVLACIGYGAVFLAAGLFFRNPVFPAVGILLWESIIFLLPPLLKKFSVAYYLKSLCPVSLPPRSVFEVLAEPAPASIAVPGIIALTGLLLVLAALRIRRMEISYASE